MFLDFLVLVLSLDLGKLVGWLLFNLHWFFMFYALMHFFQDGQKVIKGFLLFILLIFVFVDFEILTGLTVFSAGFLFLHYTTKLMVILIGENTPSLQNKLILLSSIQGYLLIAVYNLVLV